MARNRGPGANQSDRGREGRSRPRAGRAPARPIPGVRVLPTAMQQHKCWIAVAPDDCADPLPWCHLERPAGHGGHDLQRERRPLPRSRPASRTRRSRRARSSRTSTDVSRALRRPSGRTGRYPIAWCSRLSVDMRRTFGRGTGAQPLSIPAGAWRRRREPPAWTTGPKPGFAGEPRTGVTGRCCRCWTVNGGKVSGSAS